jgi:hypothetical protein
MDNLSSHKKPAVREAIEAAGASLRFLPAYSPDLNPIEQVFAKLKALLRAMALRSVAALWDALGSVVGCVSPRNAKTSSGTPGISSQDANALAHHERCPSVAALAGAPQAVVPIDEEAAPSFACSVARAASTADQLAAGIPALRRIPVSAETSGSVRRTGRRSPGSLCAVAVTRRRIRDRFRRYRL